MIVKNGEILAIDHIAHDNTLSGNGTSAKPVGLSQSTKDLIDSKVKKTDFETYKSSAANQISNINTKITTDESNFESYKSSAHDEIARIDDSIAAVNAAKVDKTTFTQYQTDVANNFTAVNKRIDDVDAAKVDNTTFDNFKGSANGELTGIKQSITDLNNAKQAKGDYVSASDFNNLKSSAHDEIERIDGRIDATNTNLSNNYYDRTTIDKKFADFGGYKFREPDPNNNNQPILNQGEDPDPKAIYLTQPEGATQYLQWIWDEEITEENKWKCIGDTTMDLSDYAKTVDVVASANNNVNAIKNWTNDNFETISDFNTVIAGYYTKGQVDTELENIAQEFVDTSAWANNIFATKTDLAGDKAELEGKINNLDTKVETELSAVSGKIIGELNSSEQALDERIDGVIIDLDNVSSTLENKITDVDNKVDTLTDELHNDYYTSNQIDAILAASGEYYTVDEVNEKLEEYAKSTDLVPITENIESISAKFNNYYTKDDVNNNFVTNTTFNALDGFVDAIDNDLDTVSADVDTLSSKVNGLHNTVIETSDTVIATPTTKPDGTISYSLSAIGGGGSQSNYLWKPTVDEDGKIEWSISVTTDIPDPANIKGPKGDKGDKGDKGETGEQGPQGETGAKGDKGDKGDTGPQGPKGDKGDTGEQGPKGDKGDTGEQGPQGEAGAKGADGKDGVSPTVTTATIEGGNRVTFTYGEGSTEYIDVMSGVPGLPGFSPTVVTGDAVTSDAHKNGGTTITVTDETGSQTFTAWNGNDGTMAGAPGITGYDGITARNTGTTYEIGLSSEFYTAITSVSSKLDKSEAASTYATKDVLNDYLTKNDAAEAYQPKGEYLSANALNGYATEAWVVDKHYLVASDIAGKADKTDLQYVSAGVDYVSGHIPIKVTDLTDSANYYTINQTSAASELTTEFAKYALLANVPTKVTDLTDSADYAKKTDLERFVTSSDVATQDTDYVMTTTGWKVLSLPGGGMTQVTHDITLTGQGNADDSKLGVAWSALSGNTIVSALSAGSATVAANLGTSSFADITGAINAKADATAISDMLTKTDAASTYQTKAGMSDYLTTTVASQTYLDKTTYATDSATYVTSGNEISAANEQYALTTTGWAKIETPATFTGVTTTGSISGGGVNNDTIGLLTSAENALKDVVNKANTADVYSKTDADSKYQQKIDMSAYLLSATYASQSGNFVTSALADFSDTSKVYGLQKTNNVVSWTEIEDSISTVETNNYISGDGTVQYPIGLSAEAASAIDAMTDQYQIDGGQYVSVVPNSTTHKVVVGLDNQATNAIADVIASANIWDEASAVSTKSHVTIDNTTNKITTENQGTSASLSAVEYKDNVNVAGMNVQQIYAVRNDSDIYACLSTTANKGTLFFVCSGIA